MTIFTADVSSWDGPVDWETARSAGISACCVKATEGGGPGYRYRIPLFAEQFDHAARAGVGVVGAYHCLSSESVDQQISYFRQAYGGRENAVSAPWFMLDVEPFDELTRRGIGPRFGDVEAFCDHWVHQTGRPLALYLPRWVWNDWGRPSLTGLGGRVALVSSNYPDTTPRPLRDLYVHAGGDSGPGWAPYGGVTPTLWQFGDSALIPGIRGGTGKADINAYRGDLVQLAAILSGTAITSTPAPQQGDPMLTNWTTVKRGDTGDRVRVAQGLLIAHQLPIGSRNGLPDGDFGPTTERSTKDLQGRYGITVDGQFGPHTLSVALYRRDLAR